MVSPWPNVPPIGDDTESIRGLIDNFKEQYGHVFSHSTENPTALAPAGYVMGLMFQANRVISLMAEKMKNSSDPQLAHLFDTELSSMTAASRAVETTVTEPCTVDSSKPDWMDNHSPGTMIKLAWDIEYPLHPYTPSAVQEMAHADVLKELEAALHQTCDRELQRIVFESIRTFEYGEIDIQAFTPSDKKHLIEKSHLWIPLLQQGDYVRLAEDYQPIIDRYLAVFAGYEAPIEIVWHLYDNLYVPGRKWRFQNHPTSFLFNSFHLALEKSGNSELAKIRAIMPMRRWNGGINIYVDSRTNRDIILQNTSLWVPNLEMSVMARITSVCGEAMYSKAPNAPPLPGPESMANNSKLIFDRRQG
ncbi:hypothetical protein N7481_008033 [Penicillium waksmanii]|uniref:uncharacterized protein n=1 Tax=Penicillium waksmanii TaxID=69791 RepID=UPI0025495ADF|nr:uncharacterized protein N7481_008033 [Penicillium waksmanii]KAJ5980735.1 hypothetical protein N7481_008033 [Penicillium waksmanii]